MPTEQVRHLSYVYFPMSHKLIWFLPKDIARGVIITNYDNVAVTFCFGATDLISILPYNLGIMTRVIPVRGVERLTAIIFFFALPGLYSIGYSIITDCSHK